uniref:Leucine-rich repeat-containing N-terminal plant-type domain-containing protein n=1 Tax=Kalanchoe fedtschenkoi TaxID=63787 RepID=A0A7N0T5N6_KALFE
MRSVCIIMLLIQLKLSHVHHTTLLLFLLAFFSVCWSSTELDYLNPAMTQVGCFEREREALMQIKAAFTDPHGKLSSGTGRDCCTNWAGVTCSNVTSHVEKLDLSGKSTSMIGDLSSCIIDLKYLIHLNLADNDFRYKKIPEFIRSMKRLIYLDISCSLFGGVIPPQLGNLSNLIELHLSARCDPAYHISSELSWLSSLSSLQHLKIRYVNLNLSSEQWLQSVNMLSNLISLDISHCKLAGRIPGLAFQNMCSLRIIDLEQNSLMSGLVELIDTLANCFNSSMRALYLNGNKLEDYLPDSLARLKNLNSIDLSSNLLFGSIPPSIGTLANLQNVELYGNLMNGTIPESLGQLERLHFLDIGGSQWQGVIRYAHLSNIQTCADWNSPLNLSVLYIWDCKLGPSFPKWIASQTNLVGLSLRNTALSGIVPDWLWNLSTQQLDYLDLSENRLQGNLLAILTLKGNNLSGELSNNNLSGDPCSSVTKFASLSSIDLGENGFSGNVPKWRGDSLEEMRLHGNLFKGNVPTDLYSLTNKVMGSSPVGTAFTLRYAGGACELARRPIPPCFGKMIGFSDLRWRFFSIFGMELNIKGNLLIFEENLGLLNFIDLSANELSGKISEQITNLSSLMSLNLSENQIHGRIPKNIRLLVNLERLDLSNNALDGPIPASLASITSLNHLNLSNNNLSGPIPTKNQFLTFNDPSIYEGNPELCGAPLLKMCDAHSPDLDHSDSNGASEKIMLYTSIVLGFIFGFWGVCGTLALKKSWRDAYFRFLGI